MSDVMQREAAMDKAVVCLTFDDALAEHLDVAMPIMERHGLRGTFFVNVGSPDFTARLQDWTDAAKRGHELGNHTVFHPGVSSKAWVTPGIALESYNLDRMRCELEVANRILQAVDGRDRRTFAFPCSNPWLGHPGWPRQLLQRIGMDRTRVMGFIDRHGLDIGSKLIDYTPLVRELFVAARCGGVDAGDLSQTPADWHRVRGVEGDGKSLDELVVALELAIERQALAPFVFHGVGGGHHMSVDSETFDRFCKILAANKNVASKVFVDALTLRS
jgi:peptidoglycan/xylan/chitin deacetylase (PgdA/CDA1 family)